MSSAFCRGGAQTMNSMFKPMVRKGYHKKSSGGDTFSGREKAAAKAEVEDTMTKGGCSCWIPDDKTGIYYPKGQEKVMEGIPPPGQAATLAHHQVHQYSDNDPTQFSLI